MTLCTRTTGIAKATKSTAGKSSGGLPHSKRLSISVIIPAYNEEKRIRDCIGSCMEHAPENVIEIIVVSNASTDGTERIARTFPGVTVVSEPQKGTGFARQKGAENARGDILAFLDADAKIHAQWFLKIEQAFEGDTSLVALSGPCKYHDLPPWKSQAIYFCWVLFSFPAYWQCGYAIAGSNFAVKRRSLEAVGGFDTDILFYGDDTSIARRLHAVGKVKFTTDFYNYASARRFLALGLIHVSLRYVLNHISQVFLKMTITQGYGERQWEEVETNMMHIPPDADVLTTLLRTVTLKDGRIIEFAEYGDLHAKPVFYFHGFLGSCHQAELSDAQAKEQGVHIVAPNRPGIGKSSPKRFGNMTEYAADIAELATMLGIGRFAIFGASAGGSFALACAYALPERVSMLGVASGMAPMSTLENWQSMHWFRRYMLSGFAKWPSTMVLLLRCTLFVAIRYPNWLFHRMMMTSSITEVDNYRQQELNRMFWLDFKSVFLQINGMRGLIDEAHLYFHWGFDIADFPKNIHVVLWHGTKDIIVPWSVMGKVADHIPRHNSVLYPGGHLAFITRMQEVLSQMQRSLGEMPHSLPVLSPLLALR